MTILRAGLVVSLLSTTTFALTIHEHPIATEHRLALTREYCRQHYGLDSYVLSEPQIIVIHTTESKTLAAAFQTFQPNTIENDRTYLHHFGEVNVGVHFLVDRNGDAYSLLPLTIVGRHVIGLNYTAIGIENVGYSGKLTAQQLDCDAALVADLVTHHSSIHYLIAHAEYTDKSLPHYKLYKELVADYKPTYKSDPGVAFIADLRAKLSAAGIQLEK